jgi:hypothetical protein
MLGEHTVDLLHGELKLSDEEIAALAADSVIGTGTVGQGSRG